MIREFQNDDDQHFRIWEMRNELARRMFEVTNLKNKVRYYKMIAFVLAGLHIMAFIKAYFFA